MKYRPKTGDLVSLHFGSSHGVEQQGWRPALVISNDLFNDRTGMAIVCPITRTKRGYPFHVPLGKGSPNVDGQVMVDQIRSVDFKARRVKRLGTAPPEIVDEALARLDACLY